MRVRMKTLMAGDNGVSRPGDTPDISEEAARDLISGGYAEAVESPMARVEMQVASEHETAMRPWARKGKRK